VVTVSEEGCSVCEVTGGVSWVRKGGMHVMRGAVSGGGVCVPDLQRLLAVVEGA